MNTLRIKSVGFPGNALKFEFSDGRSIELPLNLFAKLRDASAEHRGQWRLIGKGLGVHWESVDEDISLENLLIAYSRIKGESYVRGEIV